MLCGTSLPVLKGTLVPTKAVNLILHPVRLRIIQTLVRRERNTQQIAEALPDVPVSSLYRHLRMLLEAEYIEIASTRSVNGIEERTYSISETKPPLLADEEFRGLSKDELQQAFSMLVGMIMTSFNEYLDGTPEPDWKRDRLGCAEFTFFATPDEYTTIWKTVWQTLSDAENVPRSADRLARKIALASYPGIDDR
jgi:DNA-binding transcriptional ArsR family regulator